MYVYENIWNGIGKGKYNLSYLLWVGMWVRKNKVWKYLHKIHTKWQRKLKKESVTNMYVYENIWNRIGKGKYKLSFHLWVGMWVRKK